MSEGGDDAVKDKFTLLPEFFVDLICRIKPGIVFLPIWAAIIAKSPKGLLDLLATVDKSYALLFLIFIAFAYVIGFTAAIIADWIEPLFILVSQSFKWFRKLFENATENERKKFLKTREIFSEIDHLEKPQQVLILKKMLAEATLFKSLFVLYFVTIFLLFLIFEQCFITNMLCYSLLGIIPFLMFAIDRNIKVQERLDNFK